MSEEKKRILVVARDDKVEALRMAAGLTLLDDQVRVAVLGDLEEAVNEVQLQLESLDFADVPVERLQDAASGQQALAEMIAESTTVFLV